MKIKNVIKSCKAHRTIQVVYVRNSNEEEKWLGDGRSLWLMPEYMNCDMDGIFGIYDFSEAEQEKTQYILRMQEMSVLTFPTVRNRERLTY